MKFSPPDLNRNRKRNIYNPAFTVELPSFPNTSSDFQRCGAAESKQAQAGSTAFFEITASKLPHKDA